MSMPDSRRSVSRRRRILLSLVAVVVALAVPCVLYPADAARLVGRTETVTATILDTSLSKSRPRTGSGTSSATWFTRYTVQWVGSDGVDRTGDTTVAVRDRHSTPLPAVGDTVEGQWVPGTGLITVATVGQSILTVFGVLITGLTLTVVVAVGTRLRRVIAQAAGRGRRGP